MQQFPFFYQALNTSTDVLFCEDLDISEIANQFGTPLFIYSKQRLLNNINAFKNAAHNTGHPWKISYALKANSNIELLRIISAQNVGASVVSGGELQAALKTGFPAEQITFDGPGKTDSEIDLALRAKIKAIVVESSQELEVVRQQAISLGIVARVYIRINPHVDAKTHPYISTGLLENKFGIDIDQVFDLVKAYQSMSLDVIGLHTHIGSQITELAPFVEAAESIKHLIIKLQQEAFVNIKYLDLGGGRGIQYHNIITHPNIRFENDKEDANMPSHEEFLNSITNVFNGMDIELTVEPGRAIIADTCILVSKVLYTKSNTKRTFVIVDAAMNDLIRPSLYGAYHQIVPLTITANQEIQLASVVGPICETGDFLALDRDLPTMNRDDMLAVMCAGAYGFSLSSNYNLRPKAAEVLVDGSSVKNIRQRQIIEDIL